MPALSYFFPAHNEAENIEALVAEALEELPRLADTFEIIAVDDGSKDATGALADALAAANPGVVRAVHHAVNQGYGAALRSGFGASRYPLVCFTDGDRQFRIADLARLLARMEQPDAARRGRRPRTSSWATASSARTRSSGSRTPRRIGPACGCSSASARTDVDCACKLFRREALEGIRLESGGAFLSAELLIKIGASGRRITEVGVPHYPRTAGSPTGAKPQVIFRAVRDFWRLRINLWRDRQGALHRGEPVLREDIAGS